MLTVGPIVKEVSAEFDTYWNHKLAVPMAALFKENDQQKLEARRQQVAREMAEAGDSIYADSISTPVLKKLYAQEIDPYIADAQLLTDKPDKLLEDVSEEQQIIVNAMREALLEADSEIYIFTPYLIPRDKGMDLIRQLRARGIRVVIVTDNSRHQ